MRYGAARMAAKRAILVKIERAAMANSLEVRVPILDFTFIDWASGLPADVKLHHGQGQYVFKRSLEPVLPHDVLYHKKMGFAVPSRRDSAVRCAPANPRSRHACVS